MAVLLELLEQVAEPAADHAAGGAAREQAAEAALEDIAKTAAKPPPPGSRRVPPPGEGAGAGRRARLAAAEMLDGLPGQQARIAMVIGDMPPLDCALGCAGAARAVLHAVEYVE